MQLRDARDTDAAACRAVYAPYVTDTAITFAAEVPGVEEMAERIRAARRTHAWLVVEEDGEVLGQAYAGPYRAREAWAWATEASIYLAPGASGRGIGRTLYAQLLERLAARGYFVAVGSITLPNEASVGLHRRLGFEEMGTMPRVGWKLGRWHDVWFCQKRLREGAPSGPAGVSH